MLYFQSGLLSMTTWWTKSKRVKKQQNLLSCGFYEDFAPIHFTPVKDFVLFLHWSYVERVVEDKRWEQIPLEAQERGPKGPKMAKIAQILYFFYFAPIQFTLATDFHYSFTDILRGEQLKIIDEYEEPWEAHQEVSKVAKWPQDGSPKDQYRPFLDLWDPLVGPQRPSYSSIIFCYSPWISSV